jgi:hypothetical protein
MCSRSFSAIRFECSTARSRRARAAAPIAHPAVSHSNIPTATPSNRHAATCPMPTITTPAVPVTNGPRT